MASGWGGKKSGGIKKIHTDLKANETSIRDGVLGAQGGLQKKNNQNLKTGRTASAPKRSKVTTFHGAPRGVEGRGKCTQRKKNKKSLKRILKRGYKGGFWASKILTLLGEKRRGL